MEAVQYCGGIAAVHVGDSVSTVEAIQYCGGLAAVLQGIASVHVGGQHQYCGGIASALWRLFSTLEG